ncbi:dimethyladenosine transferase 2, mitochondrial [Daktulosphaira vitifoliae]|uniref:dimethyladenosine transferase 2, mitochondrial n=1 Tax=Daktulosphaira vitifoliae TaxID=58002 RepID=UPI0021AA1C2A|nr:dimethyladenosine transferase 2, mitochondrial [Daktulosphaira vitifoliae]
MTIIKNRVWLLKNSIVKWVGQKRFRRLYSSVEIDESKYNISLYKKRKYPETMFVHNQDVARDAAKVICSHLDKQPDKQKTLTLIEANPGPCLLTNYIMKDTNYNMILYENDCEIFREFLTDLKHKYHSRIHLSQGNLLLLWKIGFQDRMDQGDRVSKFLSSILPHSKPWNYKDPSVRIIAGLPNRKFLNYMVYSFTFQTGLMTYGRPEFYFFLPPSLFTRYSSEPLTGAKYYKTQTILFQTFFEIEFLKNYPRSAFLPPKSIRSTNKKIRFKELKEADEKSISLIRVVGRRDIFDEKGLTQDLLKPYWYFVKHHTLSRKNFVIPLLEQWIPGCGPHFFALGHTIFTQFGDLTPDQFLKVFLTFTRLPQFRESPFLSSMEMRISKIDPYYSSNVINSSNSFPEDKTASEELEDIIEKDED